MHYRQDKDPTIFDAVKDTIRKTVYKTTPDIFFDEGPRIGIFDYVLDSGEHFDGKIVTKARFATFIVLNSREKLSFSFRMK